MERFCFGRGLFILRQGRTLHFSHRASSTIYFEEPGTGETEAINKDQFWCEGEQRQISVLARALWDPARTPIEQAFSGLVPRVFITVRAPENMGKMFPTHYVLRRPPHAEPARLDHTHTTLIAKVIQHHVADPRRIPMTHIYISHYLPALAQYNAERATAGLEGLRPISARTFRRRMAASVLAERNIIRHSPLPMQKLSRTPRVFEPPNRPGDLQDQSAAQSSKCGRRDVVLLPLGELQVTAVVDRYSRCILGLRVQCHGPTRDSNPGHRRISE